jgi:hypothetical protein
VSTDFYNPISWIEGFGNLSYEIESSASHSLFDAGLILVCVQSPAGLVYETSSSQSLPEYENCFWNHVHEITSEAHLELFPNPAKNSIYLRSDLRISELKIHNALGEEVIGMEVNQTSVEMDINHLKSGYYFLEAHLSSGQMTHEKFLKL